MKSLLFLSLIFPSVLLGQHTIKGVFTPAADYNIALLYKVTPTISEYVTSEEIQKDGSFKFQLDSTATKGMYRLVYAVPQEDYNFDIIYNNKEDIELKFNSETGVKFLKSNENKLLASYHNSMAMVIHSVTNYYTSKSKDTTALNAIFKTQRETQLSFEKAAKNTIALQFIKANKPFVPTKALTAKNYIAKLKTHYFDYVDFKNPTLQSSSFLEEKMLSYVFGMTSNDLDEVENYKANIDALCKAMQDAPNEIKRMLLFDLWQEMVDLKQEAVANYISETYLIAIATVLKDEELIKALKLYRNISNGNKAPNFTITVGEKDKKISTKLSELTGAENYVIVFWSSSCSHCLDEIPQLKSFTNELEKGKLKVIAIGLEDGADLENWKKVIKDYPEFIHIYGKGKWENTIGNAYGVVSTPTYFVLDKNKVIVDKPDHIEDLIDFFNQ
ncbi:TlpA disulfide reductase family protein [Tamlana sp. 2_MG-2023]|uniref:peroxiredoxin family protein n=1 Tax=unclassified Tamlana TaxID=2614803 RepID=UPI0026E1CC6A|nr:MULTISPECIES: TlpA disulfide reductase family protein [unclassified Tamlana]MDO6759856.1 TlpA disulfide reductase family protein [Tamlana sp. 2_MG-2023]MDO6791974.1 TlpA disulfide reductase family protein [Tamlana sp. 1_MG-2023]